MEINQTQTKLDLLYDQTLCNLSKIVNKLYKILLFVAIILLFILSAIALVSSIFILYPLSFIWLALWYVTLSPIIIIAKYFNYQKIFKTLIIIGFYLTLSVTKLMKIVLKFIEYYTCA